MNFLFSKKQIGFTLLEALVVMSILAILLTVGVPSFVDSQKRNDADITILQAKSAINTARQQAIFQSKAMVVCTPNDDATGCKDSNDWSNGLIVFALADAGEREEDDEGGSDDDVSTLQDVDTEKLLLRVYGPKEHGGTMVWNGVSPVIIFQPNGLTNPPRTLSYCSRDADEAFSRSLTLATTGKIRISELGECS